MDLYFNWDNLIVLNKFLEVQVFSEMFVYM
jgi:hypothetical protein